MYIYIFAYLEPNSRPSLKGVDLNHFMGRIIQNTTTHLGCRYGCFPGRATGMMAEI